MKNSYDVIVVGAGPGGSTAARFAAQDGASVLLLEKDREPGIPVRCAEGVGEKGILTVLKNLKPEWISQKIIGANLVSPTGRTVKIHTEQVGYVLDRKRFDYDLAKMAAEAGAQVLTKAYVYDLLKDGDKITGVKVKHLGQELEIKAKIVIGADGVESRVGRWAGVKTKTAMKDMETCLQYTVAGVDIDPNYCHFYLGKEIAPYGYIWIFPKGDGFANIGMGISGEASKDKSVKEYLDEFMTSHFPEASILTTVCGGVPCAMPVEEMVKDNLMLVGDAAHQVVSESGGGIVNALLAGKHAGAVAAKAVAKNDFSEKILKEYVKLWNRDEGHKMKMHYRVKEYIYNLSDDELEEIADMVLKVPEEKRSVLSLFKTAIFKKPSLLLDVVKIFT